MADSKEVFVPGWRLTDANANPVSGGTIECYEADTLTPRDFYSDVTAADVINWTNIGPVITVDSGGYPTSDGNAKCNVYTGVNAYRLIAKTAAGATLWDQDFIPGATDTSTFGGEAVISTPVLNITTDEALNSNDRGILFNANCSGGDITLTLASAAVLGDGWRCGIRHAGSANQIIIAASGSDSIAMPGVSTVTRFSLPRRGQEVWIRCDGGGFLVGETTPSLLTTIGVIEIEDAINTPPGSPQAGDRYIVTGSPTGDWSAAAVGTIMEANGAGGWTSITPPTDSGWIAYVKDEDIHYKFVATSWVSMDPIASDTLQGKIELATAAEMETATDVVRAVTPGRLHRHPGVAKAWVVASNVNTVLTYYNVTSISDNGTGDISINWDTDFSSSAYCAGATAEINSTNSRATTVATKTAGTARFYCLSTGNNGIDPDYWNIWAFGDHA